MWALHTDAKALVLDSLLPPGDPLDWSAARADLTGCIALLGQQIVTQSRPDQTLLATPPAYATFSAGLGVWFQ